MKNLTSLPSFLKLQKHFEQIQNLHMRTMFEKDPQRAHRYFLAVGGLKLDYSKNRIDDNTMQLLFDLAKECELKEKIQAMFRGDKINSTEKRSVLHIALRNRGSTSIEVDGINVMENVHFVLKKMEKFSEQISTGSWLGYNNHFITDIVNIGIGGSDLGALMVCKALKEFGNPRLNVHFVSNVDSTQLQNVLNKIHPQTTLFIIASKTFSTQETLTNAFTARKWFLDCAYDEKHIAKHFVAVSTNKKAALDFGIALENIFEFWNWVGGRYSLWCAVGLAIMLYLGKDNFYALLEGAYLMDRHFYESEFQVNMPVILGLLGIWYINFFGANTHLIMPYDEHLRYFPKFIQQLDMESNGKSVNKNGNLVNYHTGAIIWGDMGINAQHAFFQLLHQGTWLSPIDFIAVLSKKGNLPTHHEILLSNVFAQSQAFMKGKNYEEVCKELQRQGLNEEEIQKLALHKLFPGNRVSNTLLLDELNPHIIGSLIALYEHKIFVQGVIWDINSFDQWGVELGKELAKSILAELLGQSSVLHCDASTRKLIDLYKKSNQT